jgi:hypothetical protein
MSMQTSMSWKKIYIGVFYKVHHIQEAISNVDKRTIYQWKTNISLIIIDFTSVVSICMGKGLKNEWMYEMILCLVKKNIV